MTREEILKAFLTDNLFIEKGYLKEEEVEEIKWIDKTNSKLIEVIKLAIDGEISTESPAITEKKINQLLNQSK